MTIWGIWKHFKNISRLLRKKRRSVLEDTFREGLAEVNEDEIPPRCRIQRVVRHVQPHHVLHKELYHLSAGVGVDPLQQQSTLILRGRLSHTQLHIMQKMVPLRQHSCCSCQNDCSRNKGKVGIQYINDKLVHGFYLLS